MNVRIYHNPRCSKSRETLALLEARSITPEVILYLQQPLRADALKALIRKLDVPPLAIVRTKEEAYASSGLNDRSTADEVVGAIIAAPSLLERPIVEVGERAAIGRPPENVLSLL